MNFLARMHVMGWRGAVVLALALYGVAVGANELRVPVERTVVLPADAAGVEFPFALVRGAAETTWVLVWEDGETAIRLRPGAATFTGSVERPGQAPTKTVMPDASLDIPTLGVQYFVQPNPFLYNEAALRSLRGRWARLPDVYSHTFRVALHRDQAGAGLSLDGNFVGHIAGKGRLTGLRVSLPPDVVVAMTPASEWQPELPLDLRSLDRPGAMAGAELAIDERALADGLPLRLPTAGANADIGSVRHVYPPHDIDNSVYRYYERSAFDAMPESLLMSVPAAPYTRAWVLCAMEDEPTKEAVFRLRLTRYRRGGIGNAMVTTTVPVPVDGADTGTRRRVGSVRYGTGEKQRTVALWLAEVALNSGEIQDLITEEWAAGRLDLELQGLQPNSKSGVHVFAVTLDRSPVAMTVRQAAPGSVFEGDEAPRMTVDLQSYRADTVTLGWEVLDVWGRQVATQERAYRFAAAGETQVVEVDLRQAVDGWYRVVYRLSDESGRELLQHTAAYAQLPPDTRQAGYESPFGCWWQQHLHSRMTDPAVIGPLLHKAGLRRTTRTAPSEAVMAPWQVTLDMIPWVMGNQAPGDNPEQWAAEFEAKIRDYLERFPNVGKVMIFHESYASTWLAPESWGGEPEPLTAVVQIAQAKLATAVLREKFPQLQIIVGNSGWSGALISQLLRGGLPADRIDGLGMERLLGYFAKDTPPPERHEASWAMQQIGRLYGIDAPPTDCYESGGRGNYGMSQRLIAEYVVRDSLIGLAWGYRYIGVGTVSENVNGYYHSRWGGDSILRRTPYLYPQPQYVAIATMTRVLDRARFVRALDSGSNTVYALEFARGEERVYALWTPRGEGDVAVDFAADTTVAVDGLYGGTRQLQTTGKQLSLTVGPEVTYVTARAAVTGVTITDRRFPLDAPPDDAVVLAAMDGPAGWSLANATAVDVGPHPYSWLPWRLSAKGRLFTVEDPARGASLGVELLPAERELPALLSECLTLRPAQPLPVPGRPTTLGVWVRGNSSWGRVMVEVMDAGGERFRGGEGVIEPNGSSAIDFDGWCFVSLPLTEASPVEGRFLESPRRLWRSNGGDGTMDYPIRVTGLTIETRRQALVLTEMLPVAPTLAFRDLSVYGGDLSTPKAPGPDAGAEAGLEAVKWTDPNLLYADDFQAVPEGASPPGLPASCRVRLDEDGRHYLACPAGADTIPKGLGYYGASHWQDVELSIRFRFPDAAKMGLSARVRTGLAPSPFRLHPPARGAEPYRWLKVDYDSDGCWPSVEGGIYQMARGTGWAAHGLPALEAQRWYRTVIRAAGDTLTVSWEHDGKLVEVYRGPAPAGGGGFALQAIGPLDIAELRVVSVTPTPEEWGYGDRIKRLADSPVAGRDSARIDGPFMVQDRVSVADATQPLLLSAYLRGEAAGTPATLLIGEHRLVVPTTTTWARYSFLAMPQPVDDGRCLVAVQGSDDGVVHVSAPQVEAAPIDRDARRAADWQRTFMTDYEIDTTVKRQGNSSWRSAETGRSVAVQEGAFAAAESRELRLSAWCRRAGQVRSAQLRLELFRDPADWTPKTPGEVQPSEETVTVNLPPADEWHAIAVVANARHPISRYRVTIEVESEGGTAWLDDIALQAVGEAPAAGAAPADDLVGDLLEAAPEIGLDLLGDGAPGGKNVLKNPGFETAMPGGVVTRRSNRPSPSDPAQSPSTWLKIPQGVAP